MKAAKTQTVPFAAKELVIVHEVDARGAERETIVHDRQTLTGLIERKKLYPTAKVAGMTGRTVRYIRLLCRLKMISAERILGRYYFTPKQIAALMQPIEGVAAAIRRQQQ